MNHSSVQQVTNEPFVAQWAYCDPAERRLCRYTLSKPPGPGMLPISEVNLKAFPLPVFGVIGVAFTLTRIGFCDYQEEWYVYASGIQRSVAYRSRLARILFCSILRIAPPILLVIVRLAHPTFALWPRHSRQVLHVLSPVPLIGASSGVPRHCRR